MAFYFFPGYFRRKPTDENCIKQNLHSTKNFDKSYYKSNDTAVFTTGSYTKEIDGFKFLITKKSSLTEHDKIDY